MSWRELLSIFSKKKELPRPPEPIPEPIPEPQPEPPPDEADVHHQEISTLSQIARERNNVLSQIKENLFSRKIREIILERRLVELDDDLEKESKRIKRLFNVAEEEMDRYQVLLPEEGGGKPGKLLRKNK
tara:strand:+ start:468 stop:857 length:390 start_codon:yes stop_codon:yes gene_type:complete